MLVTSSLANSIAADLFAPISAVLSSCPSLRRCEALSDHDFVSLAVRRCIEAFPSGRGFLQGHGLSKPDLPCLSTYFAALRSRRRCALLVESATRVWTALASALPDALAAFHSLREFDIYAADGHFWEAATHDEKSYKRGSKDNPAKFITGNIFALCLRNHRLRHLTLADKRLTRPQHDLSALKRLDTNALRLDAAKGRKVLYVYDRAIIDFGLWAQIKRHGIYIITRNKANLALQTCAQLTWDQAEALNA
jgi:hypothetical protein